MYLSSKLVTLLKVFVKIQEGNKTRLQMFEGVCIAKKGHGIGETFTVRKISYGVGVEKSIPSKLSNHRSYRSS